MCTECGADTVGAGADNADAVEQRAGSEVLASLRLRAVEGFNALTFHRDAQTVNSADRRLCTIRIAYDRTFVIGQRAVAELEAAD